MKLLVLLKTRANQFDNIFFLSDPSIYFHATLSRKAMMDCKNVYSLHTLSVYSIESLNSILCDQCKKVRKMTERVRILRNNAKPSGANGMRSHSALFGTPYVRTLFFTRNAKKERKTVLKSLLFCTSCKGVVLVSVASLFTLHSCIFCTCRDITWRKPSNDSLMIVHIHYIHIISYGNS